MEIGLPATTKSQNPHLWGKGWYERKEVLFRCCTILEVGGLLPWSPSPQQDQQKSQCPEFLPQFKVQSFGAHRWLLSGRSPHIVSLGCLWQLPVSDCLLHEEPVRRWAMQLLVLPGFMLLGERMCECTGLCITR